MRSIAHDLSRWHPRDMVHQALALFSRRARTNGTAARIETFYAALVPQAAFVMRIAQALVGGSARHGPEAHQLARDTILEAHRTLDSFQPGDDARRFLIATMRRLRAERSRSSAKRAGGSAGGAMLNLDVLREEFQNMSVDGATNAAVTFSDSWDDVRDPAALFEQFNDASLLDALHRLPEEIRWVLILADIEGMTPDDVARAMGVKRDAVIARLKRGRSGLRALLYPSYD